MQAIERGNEYDKQAEAFLRDTETRLIIKFKDNTCPPWGNNRKCDHVHGDRYTITFRRANRRAFGINFWNSYNDSMIGKVPRPYDVLTCVQKTDPGDFIEFCDEYGYGWDSITARNIWKECLKQWRYISNFFTAQEIEKLQEIQ